MGYILIQADESTQSLAALTLLGDNNEYAFNLFLDGPRSCPMFFGFRFNQTFEVHCQSFVDEVACVRREISCCQKYLWEKKFCWICDCIAIKGIFECYGSIHQLQRWSQEMLGYDIAIIHRIASMMKNMDGLSRHINPLIHRYLVQAYIIRAKDAIQRPFTYCHDNFTSCSNPRRFVVSDTTIVTNPLPIFLHFPLFIILPSILFKHQFFNQFLPSNINHSLLSHCST